MELENKVLSDIVGTLPCPVCNKQREYRSSAGLRQAIKYNRPCRSCTNSIINGGQGNIEKRGCFTCGDKVIYYNSLCKNCHNNRSRKYHKEIYRWSKYGLDGPVEMKCCEICSADNDLVIDHCHDTNQFRGVLCRQCNAALGLLKENKEIIEQALIYAKRTFNGN